MAEITAAMVKDLREKTGVGMMDCKAALAATNGDMEAAVDWLRAKGLAKAAKKSTRVAAEGLVGRRGRRHHGCRRRSQLGNRLRGPEREVPGHGGRDLQAGAQGRWRHREAQDHAHVPGSPHAVAEYVAEMVATIGENMTVRRTAALSVKDGVDRLLRAQPDRARRRQDRRASWRSNRPATRHALAEFGRMLAMHVAATNPVALTSSRCPPDVLARESAILEEKNAGKPANVLEKIVASGLKTFAKENCLLEQAYVHDGAKTVTQAVAEAAKAAGADVKLTGFVRMQLGEGIEKKEDDFAAEVAKMSGGQ